MTIAGRRAWIRARNNLWLRIAALSAIAAAVWICLEAVRRIAIAIV